MYVGKRHLLFVLGETVIRMTGTQRGSNKRTEVVCLRGVVKNIQLSKINREIEIIGLLQGL